MHLIALVTLLLAVSTTHGTSTVDSPAITDSLTTISPATRLETSEAKIQTIPTNTRTSVILTAASITTAASMAPHDSTTKVSEHITTLDQTNSTADLIPSGNDTSTTVTTKPSGASSLAIGSISTVIVALVTLVGRHLF